MKHLSPRKLGEAGLIDSGLVSLWLKITELVS